MFWGGLTGKMKSELCGKMVGIRAGENTGRSCDRHLPSPLQSLAATSTMSVSRRDSGIGKKNILVIGYSRQ